MSGTLYVVATPIGNLGDISVRALETLKTVDLILSEDTRVTGKLLARFKIQTRQAPYHAHTRPERKVDYLDRIEAGESMALVTDAGTPGLQDPGGTLVAAAHEREIPVIPIPGPSALAGAISAAGFPADTLYFAGFLPTKKGRQTALRGLPEAETIVIYETAPRLLKLLGELSERFEPDLEIWVGRELTKLHEETRRGRVEELQRHYEQRAPRGEFVIVIGPNQKER